MGNQVNARPTSGHVRFPQRAADTHTGCQGSGGLCVHLCACWLFIQFTVRQQNSIETDH